MQDELCSCAFLRLAIALGRHTVVTLDPHTDSVLAGTEPAESSVG